MKQAQGHISLNPEEIIHKTPGRTKHNGSRPISYGLIGKKDNHLYVYELSEEKTHDTETSTYRLLVVAVDLCTRKPAIQQHMCTEGTDRREISASITRMKAECIKQQEAPKKTEETLPTAEKT